MNDSSCIAELCVGEDSARVPKLGADFPAFGQAPWYHFWIDNISADEHEGHTL